MVKENLMSEDFLTEKRKTLTTLISIYESELPKLRAQLKRVDDELKKTA